MVVIINAGFSAATVSIPTGDQLPESSTWRNLLGSEEQIVTSGAIHDLALQARTGMVLAAH